MKRLVAIFATISLFLLVLSQAALASSFSVQVTATVLPKLVVTEVGASHLELKANTSWLLTIETRRGMVWIDGTKTGNEPVIIDLPPGTVSYSATIR